MLSTKNYMNNSSINANNGTFDNLIINDSITDYTGLYDTSNNIFIKYVSYDYLSNNYYQQSQINTTFYTCLLYTSPSPRDGLLSRMPSSA